MHLTDLAAYIPMDRRRAMAFGRRLPDHSEGSALFADISGFTPLTEALVRELGPRRGADELTSQLNRVYTAVIAQVHACGGSVIGFSGDAITTWFDGDDGLRAVACGLSIEDVMGQFATVRIPSGARISLAMKASVATGRARRLRVGDPDVQYIDVIAGAVVDRMATGEHLALQGEVVVGPRTVERLEDAVDIACRRRDDESGDVYAVVSGLRRGVTAPAPCWDAAAEGTLTQEELRPWILPPVYERLVSGQGSFLAELRPAVALFLRFRGADYERDPEAGAMLDAYVRWVQGVLARYEGYLIQLTIGDKGSYLYAAFGAPVAHEDDAERAVAAALELKTADGERIVGADAQIGISTGRMRTGAYGSRSRLTYGVLGDEVNLAARLMQASEPGQVLVTRHVADAAMHACELDYAGALRVKGKSRPVPVHSAQRARSRHQPHLRQSQYGLSMVGRESELALLRQKLTEAVEGKGQIVGITGDAGIGKTRLTAELVGIAGVAGLPGFVSECESYGTNTSYLVWRVIWRELLGVDPSWDDAAAIEAIERQVTRIDATLLPRLPLLGSVLGIPIPDNDLTQSFDPKLRKSSLEALLVDLLRRHVGSTPTLIVLEDCHWLDPVSEDLVEVIGRAAAQLPILVVLVYRPPEGDRERPFAVGRLPHFTEVALKEFTAREAERLITLKLRQFAGDDAAIPQSLVLRVTERAQGNPFYIEELLNYLRDSGIDPQDTPAVLELDLPTSLYSLILSRLDQRTESQKTTLRVASVIGRVFRAALLRSTYGEIGSSERVKADLDALSAHELTQVDTPEPDLAYLFKHIVTQEVAYESLPHATRATLHEQLASHIEQTYMRAEHQYIDLLAYHYGRSENSGKKIEYLGKAGEAAQADYANEAAIRYYEQLLPLLPAQEQVDVMLRLGEVLLLVGRWDETGALRAAAMSRASEAEDRHALARCSVQEAELLRMQGRFAAASASLDRARMAFEELGDDEGIGQVLHRRGTLAAQQGDYSRAEKLYYESLAIRRMLADELGAAALLSNLAVLAEYAGEYERARSLNEEALALRSAIGDRWEVGNSLNNLGNVLLALGDRAGARESVARAVALYREVGDRWRIANALNNLGNVARADGDLDEARSLYDESLTISRALGDGWAIAYLIEDVGVLAVLTGKFERALQLVGAASALRETIRAPLPPADRQRLEEALASARCGLDAEHQELALAAGRTMATEQAIEYALRRG